MAKQYVKQPSFTDLLLHDKLCIHKDKYNPDGCGRNVTVDKPNGWLCWEHDRQVFQVAKTVQ